MGIKQEARRKKAALCCAKKMEAAQESIMDYLNACCACKDNSGDELRGMSDSRRILARDLSEYAAFLNFKYES